MRVGTNPLGVSNWLTLLQQEFSRPPYVLVAANMERSIDMDRNQCRLTFIVDSPSGRRERRVLPTGIGPSARVDYVDGLLEPTEVEVRFDLYEIEQYAMGQWLREDGSANSLPELIRTALSDVATGLVTNATIDLFALHRGARVERRRLQKSAMVRETSMTDAGPTLAELEADYRV